MTTTTRRQLAGSRLTERQLLVAHQVVKGLDVRDIAHILDRGTGAIYANLNELRRRLGCPPGCSMAVLTHALVSAREVEMPSRPRPESAVAAVNVGLLVALTEHTHLLDVARAARIYPTALRSSLAHLLTSMGVSTHAEAVALAHSWGLMTPRADLPPLPESPATTRTRRTAAREKVVVTTAEDVPVRPVAHEGVQVPRLTEPRTL
ncbi:hypothetical protein ACWC1D_28345 [Streptomyces sp. NPDC001478]